MSLASEIHPRVLLEWASVPVSTVTAPPHGASGSSTQSHWVSEPGGCSMSVVARPLAPEQASQCGRSDRARTSRVSVW